MASLAQQFTGLRCSPLSTSRLSKPFSPKQTKTTLLPIVSASVISNAQTKERLKLKEIFEDAQERCRTAPMEGVAFNLETFYSALEKYDFNSEIGTKVSQSLSLTFFFPFPHLIQSVSELMGMSLKEESSSLYGLVLLGQH